MSFLYAFSSGLVCGLAMVAIASDKPILALALIIITALSWLQARNERKTEDQELLMPVVRHLISQQAPPEEKLPSADPQDSPANGR